MNSTAPLGNEVKLFFSKVFRSSKPGGSSSVAEEELVGSESGGSSSVAVGAWSYFLGASPVAHHQLLIVGS